MVDSCVRLADSGVAVCRLFRGISETKPGFAVGATRFRTSHTRSLFAINPSLRDLVQIKHEDFMEGINVVSAKKKGSLDYYA